MLFLLLQDNKIVWMTDGSSASCSLQHADMGGPGRNQCHSPDGLLVKSSLPPQTLKQSLKAGTGWRLKFMIMVMSSVFIKAKRLGCPICLQVLLSPWEALLEQLPRKGVPGHWLLLWETKTHLFKPTVINVGVFFSFFPLWYAMQQEPRNTGFCFI